MTVLLRSLLKGVPVLPVLTLSDASVAVPLAQALMRGGLKVLEITLRTEAALDSIREITREAPDALVAAGSVIEPDQMERAAEAGARFCVSPGHTTALIDTAARLKMPFLPGVATASEIMFLMERGYDFFKFFPAEASGGLPFLKSLAGPLPNAHFCPTGGIGFQQAQHYLSLKNVVCVGGSWLCPSSCILDKNWAAIEALASQAVTLKNG